MTILLVHFNHLVIDGQFSWPKLASVSWKPNYGDMLVCAALTRLIAPDLKTIRLTFGDEAPGPASGAVVRGSTYLHKNFDFDKAIRTIESIDAPVACVGLGAQSPVLDPKFLDDNDRARRFVSVLSERSRSISARGAFTAAVLERLGARSIRITGCPSLFYYGLPRPVAADERLLSFYRRIGVSIHSGLERNIFCRDPLRARALHAAVLSDVARNANGPRIFEQGNMLEYLIARHDGPYQEKLTSARKFLDLLNMGDLTPDQLVSYFVSIESVEEWLGKARDLDALIGFRFHGNMVGLAQGVPCFYYCYDSRLKEFCELYQLPHRDIEQEYEDPVHIMAEHDWSRVNAAVGSCHAEMRAFFEENAIPMSARLDAP